MFFYSRDRAGEHAERHLGGYGGILQADCYAGFNRLYEAAREGGPITEAACWAHARRKFFVLADVTTKAHGKFAVIAPMAFEAVKRIDAIFDVEREINGRPPLERLAERALHIVPLVADLENWMRTERARLSRHSEVAKAMDYMIKRWEAFARFLSDGRICLTNNAAERQLRGIASLESLCAPSLSACKHWKRVRVNVATRATLSGDRRFDRLGFQIGGPNLTGRSRNNLHSRKNAAGDKAAYHMA